jgi:hypothetical protein
VRDAQLWRSCAFENEHFGLFVGMFVIFPDDLDQVCCVVRVCDSDWWAREFVVADVLFCVHVVFLFRGLGLGFWFGYSRRWWINRGVSQAILCFHPVCLTHYYYYCDPRMGGQWR